MLRLKLADIDQVQVNGDRDRLKQVLLNLVGNAIQYTPQGGEVYMSLAIIGETGCGIIVRDTGPGIPPKTLPYIFERFLFVPRNRAHVRGPAVLGWGFRSCNGSSRTTGERSRLNRKRDKGRPFGLYVLPIIGKPK